LTKGLSEAVKEHCGYITSDKMSFEFSESGDRKLNSLCERQVVILFRIIQEILNNCVKYSEASTIVIHLDWGMQLFINVVNNGKAFQIDDCFKSNNQGVGMYNIIERVKAVGGSIISDAGPPNTIQIQVPADANA
jgi:two-component system NarL family sensor kinase